MDRSAPDRRPSGRRPSPLPPAARRRARRDVAVAAVVAVAVLLVVGGAAVVLRDRDAHAAAAVGPSPRVSPAPVRPVAVVGDGLAEGAAGPDWIAAAASAGLVPVVTRVEAGAGYLAGVPGHRIGDLAARAPSSARAVVLLGGGADAGRGALDLLRAETAAITAARAAAPEARLVLVGPVAATGTATVRRTLASAARLAGARFVDPVAEHWIAATGVDPEHPDAAERAELADRLAVVLDQG